MLSGHSPVVSILVLTRLQSLRPGLCGGGTHGPAFLDLLCWQSASCYLHSPVLLAFPPRTQPVVPVLVTVVSQRLRGAGGYDSSFRRVGWAAAQSRHP